MNSRQPPLKALRAFEAAGRHLSLTRAADELFVSPGAISQQVKLLEEFLDTPLFNREHRQISLTGPGQALLPVVSGAFDQINQAVTRLGADRRTGPITVSAAPSVAAYWLVPRLHHFSRHFPDIDVRIDTAVGLSDLAHSDIDVGIRFGAGDYPGLRTDFLSCVEVTPVCAPQLIRPEHPLNEPSDLRHYHLLHYDYPREVTSWPDWQMWLAAAGARGVDSSRGVRFREVNLLHDATVRGQGVSLAGNIGIERAVEAGELVKPFSLSIPQDFAYYMVSLESAADDPRVEAFRTWILEEMSTTTDPVSCGHEGPVG